MRTLGNILWHIPFLGFISAIVTYILGLIFTLTVVAAPIGLGLMEFGKFLFWPFGNAMVSKEELNVEQNQAWLVYSKVIMLIYVVFLGWILAVSAALWAVGMAITIIGIPAALVMAKSLGTYFNPVNKKCVHYAVAEELARMAAKKAIKETID